MQSREQLRGKMLLFGFADDGLSCRSEQEKPRGGVRSNKGVKGKGKYYFEITQLSFEGDVRVGWSIPNAAIDLGTDSRGFGYSRTATKAVSAFFSSYGETYGINDTIGSLLDLDLMRIRFHKNGKDLGHAFDIDAPLQTNAFFAHVCLKNCEIKVNFGAEPFKSLP
ncbi:unnamed protein product, partial [Didymodactylos carnosus]